MQKLAHSSIEPLSFHMKWDIMTKVDGDKYVNKTLRAWSLGDFCKEFCGICPVYLFFSFLFFPPVLLKLLNQEQFLLDEIHSSIIEGIFNLK